jgi:hypothetical protein
MHPDGIGDGYDTWKRVMFGAIHTTGTEGGAPPEFVKVLKEFNRIRDGERDQELARIAAGAYASKGGITMGSLVRNKREYPAAYYDNRVTNADPLPGCRDLLVAPEHVVMFTRFETFMRYANYNKTSWKWIVRAGYYVVPNLKAQVYHMIQGGYEGITKEDFDGVWDGGQHSEIYEFAFKRYLADMVRAINSTTPRVEPTAGEPGDEATAGGSSKPQEPVTTVGHVGPSKLKHLDRQRKRFTKEQVLNYLAKTSTSVHYFEAPEVIHKAVSGALNGQKNAAKDTKELLRLFALLHAKSSKTGTAYK